MHRTLKSPLPGVFYRRPTPDANPYVSEGERVRPGDIVGFVEIMKTFYEIRADKDGIVRRFLVENETAVDAGQDIVVLDD